MAQYIARRLLAFIPTLLVVSFLIFFMVYLVPGDPASMMLGPEATGEQLEVVRDQLGLNEPLHVRFVDWYSSALQGDLGESFFLNQPVGTALLNRLPVTLSLTFLALGFSLFFGVGAGVIASIRQGRFTDWGVMLLAILGLSIPIFWLALNMIWLFAVHLGWFPTGGYVAFSEDPLQFFRHLLMPAVALGLVHMAVIARMTRSSMLEVLRQDYVRSARAKGLTENNVVLRHAFRNALIPIITIIGISIGEMLAGSVITETVFNLPGVGRLVVDAVKRRDYPLIQGGILIITASYLIVNLLVDLLYAWINPRIRYD